MTTAELAPPSSLAQRVPSMLASWMSGRLGRTQERYADSLARFADYLGASGPAEAMERLLSLDGGAMNQLVLDYRNSLIDGGLMPRTVNNRIAAIRSATKLARLVGLTNSVVEVPDVKVRATNRGGMSRDDLVAMIGSEPLARDKAMLAVMGERAIRSEEICRLDIADWTYCGGWGALMVHGKGDHEKTLVRLAPHTAEFVRTYLAERGDEPGPMFLSTTGKRLETSRLRQILRAASKRIGKDFAPHDLRRHAISTALELTNGNVRDVQQFSRHRSVASVMIYDDRRRDRSAAVAMMVAGDEA
jgi:integrase/recombinase XerC